MHESRYFVLLAILITTPFTLAFFDSSFPGGAHLQVRLLNATHVRFKAFVPNSQYFALGIGKPTLDDCDMVLWHADKEFSSATDLFSFSKGDQTVDAI